MRVLPFAAGSLELTGFRREKNPFMVGSFPGVEVNVIFGPATKFA